MSEDVIGKIHMKIGDPGMSAMSEDVMSENYIESEKCDGKANVIQFTDSSYVQCLQASQINDPKLKVILVEIGVKPSRKSISELPPSVKVLLGQWDQLEVREGIRYIKVEGIKMPPLPN